MKFYALLFSLSLPTIVAAQTVVVPFQTIPFLSGSTLTTGGYVQALYYGAIAIAAMLVVIRLIWAGTEYMLSDLVTSKAAAKSKIQNALLGLLIILAAVTILNTINPNLNNLNVIGTGGTVTITDVELTFDSVQFRPGDVRRSSEIARHCESEQRCLNAYVDALNASCQYNGGRLNWRVNPSLSWSFWTPLTVGYGYYDYTCI